MLSKEVFLQLGDDYLLKHRLSKRTLNTNKYDISLIKDLKIDIKSKKVNILIDGEEINIKLLTLPKCSDLALNDLIKNELSYYFRDVENITFNYVILKEDKYKIEVVVFCIDNRQINIIDKFLNNKTKISGVYLVQFGFLEYFKNMISEKDYIFVFIYSKKIYFTYCSNNLIRYNSICDYNDYLESFNDILARLMGNIRILNDNDIKKVYFANGSYSELLREKLNDYDCVDLGYIDEKRFFKIIK